MDGENDLGSLHKFGKWISVVIRFLVGAASATLHKDVHHYEREHEVTALRWTIRDPTSHRDVGWSPIKSTRP